MLGCVAQQEGEKIFERAPHVSLVCGSASYPRFGEMLVQLEAGNRRVTGLSLDTDETFDTPFTRRDNPHRAYITIIEGCDKSCAYCVVPFTRGPERSRTSESVMAEARAPGRTGLHRNPVAGAEREQLSRSVARGLGFRHAAGARGGDPGHPPRALHHFASARFRQEHRGRHGCQPGALRSRAPAGAVGFVARAGGHGPALHARRVHAAHRVDQERAAPVLASPPTSSWASPARPKQDFEETLDLLDEVQYDSLFSFKYSPRPNTAALAMEDRVPEEEKQRRLLIAAGEAARHPDPAQRRVDRRHPGGAGGRPPPGAGPVDRPDVATIAR